MKVIKLKCPTEATESKKLWKWAQYHDIAKHYLFAIPNGGSRNIKEAAHMKQQGVKSGVSDYMLAYPTDIYHGLWIELKRANRALSRLTEEQANWLALCERVGYATVVAYGADSAIRAIEEYLR